MEQGRAKKIHFWYCNICDETVARVYSTWQYTCIEETGAKKIEPPPLQYTCHIAPPTRNGQRATPLSFRFSADKLKTRFPPSPSYLVLLTIICRRHMIISCVQGEGVLRMLWNDGMIYCFIITCCLHPPTIQQLWSIYGPWLCVTFVWCRSILEYLHHHDPFFRGQPSIHNFGCNSYVNVTQPLYCSLLLLLLLFLWREYPGIVGSGRTPPLQYRSLVNGAVINIPTTLPPWLPSLCSQCELHILKH